MQIHADPITVNCRKVLAGLDFLGVPSSFSNGFSASEARQAEGNTLVGKRGWEAWVCG